MTRTGSSKRFPDGWWGGIATRDAAQAASGAEALFTFVVNAEQTEAALFGAVGAAAALAPDAVVLACATVPPAYAEGLARRIVQVDGAEVKLTPTEYELLRVLVTHAGKVVTHQHLLREVWGPADVDQTHYLRVYFGQLRHKIETDPAQPQYILTEPGVGYRLRLPE